MIVFHFLWILFNWPNGIVVGNLIASLIWGVPSMWHLHRKINRHHRWHIAKDANIKGDS